MHEVSVSSDLLDLQVFTFDPETVDVALPLMSCPALRALRLPALGHPGFFPSWEPILAQP